MSLPVEFLSEADAELRDIFNAHEDLREGFGVEFLTAVDAYLARIAAFPHIKSFHSSRSLYRKVLFDQIIVQLGGWTFSDNRTSVHDIEAIRHIEAKFQVLFDEQDADFSFGFNL